MAEKQNFIMGIFVHCAHPSLCEGRDIWHISEEHNCIQFQSEILREWSILGAVILGEG